MQVWASHYVECQSWYEQRINKYCKGEVMQGPSPPPPPKKKQEIAEALSEPIALSATKREVFTADDIEHLVQFLAESTPDQRRRGSLKLYGKLTEVR
jgi:hypothetical protein